MDYQEVVNELIESIDTKTVAGTLDVSGLPAGLDENVHYFLSKCNGGYSSDSYFHFFGTSGAAAHDINAWNSKDLWKGFYDDEVLAYFCFAEDIFGNQFGVKTGDLSGTIYMFWVDDGRLEVFADNFELFVDYTVFGFETFRQMRDLCEAYYAASAEPFTPLKHLSYKTPILLGGNAGDVGNLEVCDAVANLRILGQLVTQCRTLAVGTKIIDVLIDKDSQTITLISE